MHLLLLLSLSPFSRYAAPPPFSLWKKSDINQVTSLFQAMARKKRALGRHFRRYLTIESKADKKLQAQKKRTKTIARRRRKALAKSEKSKLAFKGASTVRERSKADLKFEAAPLLTKGAGALCNLSPAWQRRIRKTASFKRTVAKRCGPGKRFYCGRKVKAHIVKAHSRSGKSVKHYVRKGYKVKPHCQGEGTKASKQAKKPKPFHGVAVPASPPKPRKPVTRERKTKPGHFARLLKHKHIGKFQDLEAKESG